MTNQNLVPDAGLAPSDAARVTQLLTNVDHSVEALLATGNAPEAVTPDALTEMLREHAHRIHRRHCAAVHEDVVAALARIGRPDDPVTPQGLQRRIQLCLSDVTPSAPTVESLMSRYGVDVAYVAEEDPAAEVSGFLDQLDTAVSRLDRVGLGCDGEFETASMLLAEATGCEGVERDVLVRKAVEYLDLFGDMVGEYRLMAGDA